MERKNKTVFVGVSGGVDSSVAAALLKKQGYTVAGVFIKVWQPSFLPCNWEAERLSAMRVCAALEIPFHTFDFEKLYKQEVVDYMIAEYQAGRTPNPDVMCNRYIKFGGFLSEARRQGADYIATGHYARRTDGEIYELHTAVDKDKDQTYFLWTLDQEQLKHALFPVGAFTKPKIREMAKEFGLPTADKKDSQGLCFIGKLDMKEFLKHFIPQKEGEVVNQKGDTVGFHEGATFYTIGQRHGFTITEKGDRKPYYVLKKDVEKNILYVSHKKEAVSNDSVSEKQIRIQNTNWISGLPEEGTVYSACTRYHGERVPCTITDRANDQALVTFTGRVPLTPSGQSLVVYEKREAGAVQRCVGGGVIV